MNWCFFFNTSLHIWHNYVILKFRLHNIVTVFYSCFVTVTCLTLFTMYKHCSFLFYNLIFQYSLPSVGTGPSYQSLTDPYRTTVWVALISDQSVSRVRNLRIWVLYMVLKNTSLALKWHQEILPLFLTKLWIIMCSHFGNC